MLSRIKELCKYTFQYACITHCTFEYVGDFVVCNGPSMEPTLYTNNVLLTERMTKRLHNYKRGDIVVAVSPSDPQSLICKRIVAIAGDKITNTPKSDSQDINKENYGYNNSSGFMNWYHYVPRGCVWIEGDNKANSSDSRIYGPLPMGLIRSRVICRIWPLHSMRFL